MLTWILVLELIGVLALPLTTRLFQHVPTYGIAFSKIIGSLIVSWLAWMLAMFNLTAFNFSAVSIGLLGLGVLSWQAWRGVSRQQVMLAIRQHWRTWLWYEILFVVLFWIGVQIRLHGAYGSGIHYTEKPMELMMLSSVVNSPSFPPQDLWLSGYTINYYYFGYVVVGMLMMLSNVSLGVAFNLGMASVIALTGTAIAGLIASMIKEHRTKNIEHSKALRLWVADVFGVLAIGLILFTGNQIGALQRITGTQYFNTLNDSQRMSALNQALSGKQPITLDPATIKRKWGDETAFSTLPQMTTFDWWSPSRAFFEDLFTGNIIVDGVEREGVTQAEIITEFPFFSFFLADLHPHVLALPFVMLVLALAWRMILRPTLPMFQQRGSRLEWFVTSLAIGSLYMLNSWDAPTYGFIFMLALWWLFGQHHATWTRREWLAFGKQLGLIVLGAAILFAPFLITFDSFAGRETIPPPFDSIPVIRTIGKIIAPARDHSTWSDLVIVFGLFLVPIIAWTTRSVRDWRMWLSVIVVFVFGLLIGVPALMFAPLCYLVIQAAWRQSNPALSFGLILAGVGTLLILVVDIIYLRDNFDRRFNTVFKVYYQAWLILGLVAGYALWALFSERWWLKLGSIVWMPLFGLLLAGALVYPMSTIVPKLTADTPNTQQLEGTLDSSYTTSGARSAAAWLKQNAPQTTVIASASGSSYRNGGEVAGLTGFPTLLNWQGSHEALWRTKQPQASAELSVRANDLVQIYTNPDVNLVKQTLQKYKVNYIILGPNERDAYPQNTGITFEQVGEKVFDQDGWVIYQVLK